MTHLPLVVAIVLNWNKAQDTVQCVEALRRQDYARLQVTVIDNGSAPGSLAPIEALSPPVRLIQNARNLGFAGGVNAGIAQAQADGADFIWLMNNDAMPEPGALSCCVAAMAADPRLGLVSPVILNADADDRIEFCGGVWDDGGAAFRTTDEPATYLSWAEARPERIWLVGTALLIRRYLADEIGGFDEALFAYWEDNDYSVRAIGAGFRCAVALDARVRHWSGRPATDPGLKPVHYHYYMARNEILFMRKTLASREWAKPLLWAVERQLRRANQLRAYPDSARAVFLGLWDGFLGRGGAFMPGRKVFGMRALRLAARILAR